MTPAQIRARESLAILKFQLAYNEYKHENRKYISLPSVERILSNLVLFVALLALINSALLLYIISRF